MEANQVKQRGQHDHTLAIIVTAVVLLIAILVLVACVSGFTRFLITVIQLLAN